MAIAGKIHYTQTTVTGTGAVTVVAASGDALVYRDLIALIITTPNAAAATLTLKDGTATVAVLNYPNAAAAPTTPLIVELADMPLMAAAGNTAWTITASVNGTNFQVTAIWVERQ